MGNPPGRPSNSHWKGGQKPFLEYLDDCKPQFVLVLGKGVWNSLPPAAQKDEALVREDESRSYRIYRHKGGDAFVFGIYHPAWLRWSYGKWHPWVKQALAEARRFHR